MAAIAIAVSPAIPISGGGLTTEWLSQRYIEIYGSSILGLWVGESIIFDGNNRIASWPGLIGPTFAKFNTGSSYPRRNVRNGRVGIINNESMATVTSLLVTLADAPKSVGAVALSNEVPIQDDYNILIRGNPHGTTNSAWTVTNSVGTSRLFDIYSTKYRDSTATTAIDTNLHFYSSNNESNAVAGISIFGYSHLGHTGWQGEAYALRSLSVVPTPEQLSAELSYLTLYGYRLGST